MNVVRPLQYGWPLFLGILALGTLAGCHKGYNLNLTLDPQYASALGDEHAFVHVAPVNASDRKQLEDMSLESYWRYGDTKQAAVTRERATKIFELSKEHPSATLGADDPVWDVWKGSGASELMIVSSLPVPDRPGAGERDPRRRFIPFDRNAWTADPVKVVLTSGGLRVQTSQAR